jgi:uncharacterized protein YacL
MSHPTPADSGMHPEAGTTGQPTLAIPAPAPAAPGTVPGSGLANTVISPVEQLARSRAVVVRIVRMAFVVLMATVTLLYILKVDPRVAGEEPGFNVVTGWYVPFVAAILLSVVVLLVDFFTPQKKLSTISGLVLGIILGLLATFAFGFVLDLLSQAWDIKQPDLIGAIKVLLGLSFCYLGVSVVLQTQDEFRLVIPYVEFAKQIRGPKPLLLDTSALIDSRILDVAPTGFIQVPMIVPRFVIAELQALADSSEKLKRAKGKRGLETVNRLQRLRTMGVGLDVTIDESPVPGKSVDQMLVELARITPAGILTADAALARVAAIENVSVLNLNDLANALKPALVTGTSLTVEIVRLGEHAGQGVGYLDDGTMIVVDNAAHAVGSAVPAEVTTSLTTSAGRLIFARYAGPRQAIPDGPASGQGAAAHDEDASAADGGNEPASTTEAQARNTEQAALITEDAATGSGGTSLAPKTVNPPGVNSPAPKPGPFGPKRFERNPSRNPRR